MIKRNRSVNWKTEQYKSSKLAEKKNFENEENLGGLGNKIKHTNNYTIGDPEGKEREKGAKNLFKEIILILKTSLT